jgi:lysophospholipase
MNSPYLISKEADLTSSYAGTIQLFWQQKVIQSTFIGQANVEIAYAYGIHPEAIGSVVLSSGRIESLVKYKEVVYDLYQNGYSVFIHDHRGQGLSGRLLDNPHMGYVFDFTDYVTDSKQFIDEVVSQHSQDKPKLLCHSMGGAIGALLVLRHPELFEKVAFSAPMFGIQPVLPSWLSNLLLKLHGILNKPEAYFFGQRDYDSSEFDRNNLTHSEIRYQIFRQEYQTTPNAQLGGVTGHWLKVAAEAMDEIENNMHNFPIPTLVIQAGADHIIDNKRQRRVVTKMPNTKLIVMHGSAHELLEEQDQYRLPCLTAILDFFAE